MSPEQTRLLEKARNYCAFQERSMLEVKTKLESWSASANSITKIILLLEQEGFLNEERMANVFAISKLRQNKWGKNKIIFALRQKQVPDLYIQQAINSIDDDEYLNTLKTVISNKKSTESNSYKEQAKLVTYAMQKGFQSSLAWKVIKGEI
ncbi:MAG: RecX family transcriptional regulator [Bacteroidetes bacterium]|nr:RecX family transcriptional regulator [Bacteroidota bacterium]